MKIIIVGGGCAGLTALHTLKKKGHDVLVIEKENIAGGRMRSFEQDGFCLDRCAQMVHPGYKTAREVMADLDMLDLYDAELGDLRVYDEGDMILASPSKDPVELAKTMRWMGKMYVQPVQSFMEWALESVKGLYEGSSDWVVEKNLDTDISFADFVTQNFGEEVLEMLAQPIFAAVGLDDPENVSVAFGVQIMWTVLCGEAAVLKRGLGSLAKKIVDTYPDSVMTGSPATEIVIKNGKVEGVQTETDFYAADVVICATTATKALKIIPNLPESLREPLSRVKYCPVIHTMMGVDRPMITDSMSGVLIPRKSNYPFSVAFFESTRKSPDAVPFGKDCVSTFIYGDGARRLWKATDKEIEKEIHEDLKELFDHMPDQLLFTDITRVSEANYIMPPGCTTAIKNMRENNYRDVDGLFLCGEYMYTGSYESAINSGQRCAEAVMGERDFI
jgi:protoporphyrinogen oxidase